MRRPEQRKSPTCSRNTSAAAEGLHGACTAGVDDLEAAALGAGAGALGVVADQARADLAAAVSRIPPGTGRLHAHLGSVFL